MTSLLRDYISAILLEMNSNPAVGNQLIPKKPGVKNPRTTDTADKDSEEEKGKEDEMDEMSVAANIAGYTAPLGASSADVGANPTKPGQKLKKNKKNFVRWK